MSHGSATRVGLVDLINHLGPETVAEFTGPLTVDEQIDVESYVRHFHGGSYSAALGVQDAQLAAEVDALMGVFA